MSVIKTSGLTLAYNGTEIVKDLDLVVTKGEVLGLLGPNGTGKTTIMKALAGLLKPKAGAAYLFDEEITAIDSARRARLIGMVPQGEGYVWPLTVEEIVMLGRAPHRGWLLPLSTEDKAVVNTVLEQTGLLDLRERPVDKLSGGERQRVMIARALAQEPQILLLDEPTANLDIHHQLGVLSLIRGLVETRGLTAVIAIHDLALAARTCDRLVLIRKGAIHAAGPVELVLTPDNLRAVFNVEGQLYKDPWGRWAIALNETTTN